jgi:glycosyltransferase involved in cell wall biosynthesis
MSEMKCLHITTIDLTAFCFLRGWMRFLRERGGFDVTLATTVQSFRAEIEEAGVRVVNIPISRSVNPVSDLISLVRLYYFIRKEKFQSVHTYTTKAGFIGRLAAKLAGVPVIIHTIFEPAHNSASNPILKSLYIFMERLACRWADAIITITNANSREILQRSLVEPQKLTVVPEGLDMTRYDAVEADPAQVRSALGIPQSAPFILTVARLEAPKGHAWLLKAAKIILETIPSAHFVCVGMGRLRESLEKMAQQMGIGSQVHFIGFRQDMLQIMKSCDLFVLPSLWEGQGVVLLEAMAFKKAQVASAVGGIMDVVVDGETGVLVPPKDPQALAQAIVKLINDPQTRQKMGEKGYERVRTVFDEAAFNLKRFKVYEEQFTKKKLKVPDSWGKSASNYL